eukprot:11103664-Alexandrium_andersonii.AAC.1
MSTRKCALANQARAAGVRDPPRSPVQGRLRRGSAGCNDQAAAQFVHEGLPGSPRRDRAPACRCEVWRGCLARCEARSRTKALWGGLSLIHI